MPTPQLDWLPLEAKSSVQVVASCANIAAFVASFDHLELGRFGKFGYATTSSVWCVVVFV
jgi:hypothetical protein